MLSDTAIRTARPGKKPRKMPDGGGLYIFLAKSGAKSWRYDFRLAGKRGTYTIGLYPDIGVARARELHAEARKHVAAGQNPSKHKQRAKHQARVAGANTVAAIGEEWFAALAPHRSHSWRGNARRWLDNYIGPKLGPQPVSELQHEPAEILSLIQTIAESHPKTAEDVRKTLVRIFQRAIVTLRAKQNPARECAGAIVVPPAVHHKPMPPSEVYGFTEKLDKYHGRIHTRLALRGLLLTATRKEEMTDARQSELDLPNALWRIPAARMKNKLEHIVPLSRQALQLFEQLVPLACGSEYLFPNVGDLSKPMSGTSINAALERMGVETVPHALRSTFSTWANENGYNADHIERCLAHVERNKVRGSYNAAEYLDQRRVLLQAWADFCDRPPNVASLSERRRARA